jgi:imidazole glycerol-phosphate synthase subunit HisH
VVVIVDYGMGNVASIATMLKKIGAQVALSADTYQIASADKLILPGVGAFDSAMQSLQARNLIPVLNECVLQRRMPVLGICLGMQLFTKGSEEGKLPGLGWLNARTIRISSKEQQPALRVPHMGWNTVHVLRPCVLFRDTAQQPRFYFVHSYHVICDDGEDVTAITHHGVDFASSFERGNVFGVQFHPEKSHKFGMKVLENFVCWAGSPLDGRSSTATIVSQRVAVS